MDFKGTAVLGKSIGFQLVVGNVCLLQRGERTACTGKSQTYSLQPCGCLSFQWRSWVMGHSAVVISKWYIFYWIEEFSSLQRSCRDVMNLQNERERKKKKRPHMRTHTHVHLSINFADLIPSTVTLLPLSDSNHSFASSASYFLRLFLLLPPHLVTMSAICSRRW